jgi:hypothetical protein
MWYIDHPMCVSFRPLKRSLEQITSTLFSTVYSFVAVMQVIVPQFFNIEFLKWEVREIDSQVENLVKVACIICYWKPIGTPHASETMARALYRDPIPVGALFGSSSLSSQVGGPSPTNLQ